MSQSLTLPVAGLMTDPGPFTAAPEGGLLEAENVVVMRPGVIEPRQGMLWVVDAVLKAGAYAAHAMYSDPLDNAFVWALSGTTWIIRRNPSTISGPTAFTRGKIRVCPTGGRALFTSDNGVCTLPSQMASPDYGSATIAYRAGMPQPYAPAISIAGAGVTTVWLPNGESVAYRVTLRRRLENGAIVESAPSGRIVVTNAAGVTRATILTDVLGGAYYAWIPNGAGALGFNDLLTGDELCVYRSPRINGTPSDEMKLRAVLTWNTTYAGFVSVVNGAPTPWVDGLDDTEWTGPALYTNATQEGAAFANFRPEYARDVTLYNAMTFYAGAQSPQRVDLVLKKLGVTIGTQDASQQLYTFAFAGDTLIGTNTILNVTNDILFSVGQVVTLAAQAPDAASATFPLGTYVTAIDTTTNTVTLSANALATGAGVAMVAWDWIESSIANTRIYYTQAGAFTLPARYFTASAASLDNRWNGDAVTSLQLRCSGVSQTTEIVCSFFQPDCTSAAFSIRSSKPFAWDRLVDNVTGVASEPIGGIAELQWSKFNEPEHCPIPSRTVVGDAAYAIRRIIPARNSLLILKDDGLFQCYGQTPGELSFELLDRTITLPAPATYDEQCKWVDRFDDRVVAMTTRGPMVLSDAGGDIIGAPVLESLRRAFMASFGALDDALRAMTIDVTGRRVGFVWNVNGTAVAYVVDMETGTWTYWTWRRPIGASATRSSPSAVTAALGIPISPLIVAGGYQSGIPYSDRTMLDDASVTVTTMPKTFEDVIAQTCTISSVTGTGPYTVTIAAGSEWTPTVGDLVIQTGVAYEVTRVTSATVFTVDTAGLVAAVATWREGFPIRVIWLGRAEGNTTADKTLQSVVYTLENSTLVKGMRYYVRGYRNQNTASTGLIAASAANGASPWAMVPEYERYDIPRAHASDWAHRVGFTITRAGLWFSTAGVSVIFANADPDLAGGRRR